jgi:DNA-directed RNA polymerase subunit RPC12/RpoP
MPDKVLVGMRTTHCILLVPGARDGYKCTKCGAEITLFPSGQALLEEGMPLICDKCFIADPGTYCHVEQAPGAAEEQALARELHRKTKN